MRTEPCINILVGYVGETKMLVLTTTGVLITYSEPNTHLTLNNLL